MTDLTTLRQGWDKAAKDDAMFNILTDPSRNGNRWDPAEFFARGTEEIDAVMARLDDLGLRKKRRQLALDFGCGVGRLTQALAEHYKKANGVDVSGEMVSLARDFNTKGRRVEFFVNPNADLGLFGNSAYDMIYSVITLQHMPQHLQRGYVVEFLRILHPDGLAVFQIPEGGEYRHPNHWLSMFGTPRDEVESWVTGAGGSLADVEVSEHSGQGWTGWRYTAVRG